MARDRVLNYMTRRLGQALWVGGVRHPFTLVCFLRTLAVVLHSLSPFLSLPLSLFCFAVSSIFLILYNTLFIIHFRFVLLLWQRSRQSAVDAGSVSSLLFLLSATCSPQFATLHSHLPFPWPAPLTYPGQTHTHTQQHTHPQHVRAVPPPARQFLERLL